MPDDTKPPDPVVEKVIHAGRARRRHSPLYLWMREHHATLQAEFEAHGPAWPERTVAMGEAGLTDQTGKAPTVRTAMQTWYRVTSAMKKPKRAARIAPAPSTPEPAAVKPSPAPAVAKPMPPPVIGADATEPADFDFKFAGGLKDWTKKPAGPG